MLLTFVVVIGGLSDTSANKHFVATDTCGIRDMAGY